MGIDNDRAIDFPLNVQSNANSQIQVRGADFQRVAFEPEGKIIQDLNGGFIRHRSDDHIQGGEKFCLFNLKFHEFSLIPDHDKSNPSDDHNDSKDSDARGTHFVSFRRSKVLGVLLCFSAFSTAHKKISIFFFKLKTIILLGKMEKGFEKYDRNLEQD